MSASSQHNDLLIRNTEVWAGNPPSPHKGWIAFKGGKVSEIGSVKQQPPAAKKVIDARNQVVMPSFVDCHTHVTAAALANISKNGRDCKSKHDALAAVEKAARLDTESEWLAFFYMDWDSWEHPVPPTAQELDEASGGRNVFLICESLHRGVLSESGLRACNIGNATNDAYAERKRGQLNGIVWETTFSQCLVIVFEAITQSLGEGGLEQAIMGEVERHLAYGITDAHDPGMTKDMSKVMTEINSVTPLRLSWSEVGNKGPLSSAGDGDSLESFGDGPSSAKVFTDGAHRCAMCIDASTALKMGLGSFALALKKFSVVPLQQLLAGETVFENGKIYRKAEIFTPEELSSRLNQLDETHDRIKIHALGNAAVDMACDCIVESGITRKVCIEHATIIDRGNLEKLSKHDIQVSLQSGFLSHYGDFFLQMKLTDKYRGIAARSMLDAGVDLILSSDSPCGPLEPLHNLRCAVNRTLPDNRTYLEEEAISLEEAVYAYTLAGQKGITGIEKQGLEIGAPADFIILSGDPIAETTVVESTWIDGHQVYSSADALTVN